LNVYLDASVIVSLFVLDSFAARARSYLATTLPVLVVSDFVSMEFASAVARRVRTKELAVREGRSALANFDAWRAKSTAQVEISSADVKVADAALRRLDLTLRAPDALNIAIAQRYGAELATFDEKMAACARKLGARVVAI
jgi:predicted nucleic acid-binding protein